VLGGTLLLLAAFWFGFERRRFAGPPTPTTAEKGTPPDTAPVVSVPEGTRLRASESF
jgi:hypothetical protein